MQDAFSTTSGMWHIIGASVPGSSHLRNGHGCDDAHAYKQRSDGTMIAAIADGAGSASRSAEGANLAVDVALHTAEMLLSQQPAPISHEQWLALLESILKSVRDAITAYALREVMPAHTVASDSGEDPQESITTSLQAVATTLLLAIVTTEWTVAAQIGDGAMVIQQIDGTLQMLTVPDHGEYINETCFITENDYLNHVQYKTVQTAIEGIALFTDGLQMLAMDTRTNTAHRPFFTPLFKFASFADSSQEELVTFLDSERICARTDDDKTLVLAVRG